MFALMLAVQYCILNNTGGLNGTFSNVSSLPGLLQAENSNPCLYGASGYGLLGFGILATVILIAFGVMTMRFDVLVAGSVAMWIGTGVGLLLEQLSILNPNVLGLLMALAVIFTFISMLRGGMDPY
jgi:hypothetical protein